MRESSFYLKAMAPWFRGV